MLIVLANSPSNLQVQEIPALQLFPERLFPLLCTTNAGPLDGATSVQCKVSDAVLQVWRGKKWPGKKLFKFEMDGETRIITH